MCDLARCLVAMLRGTFPLQGCALKVEKPKQGFKFTYRRLWLRSTYIFKLGNAKLYIARPNQRNGPSIYYPLLKGLSTTPNFMRL